MASTSRLMQHTWTLSLAGKLAYTPFLLLLLLLLRVAVGCSDDCLLGKLARLVWSLFVCMFMWTRTKIEGVTCFEEWVSRGGIKFKVSCFFCYSIHSALILCCVDPWLRGCPCRC